MENNKLSTYYIENLTAGSCVFSILPYFLNGKIKALQEAEAVYYFNSSKGGVWLASFILRFAKKWPKRVDFRQADMRNHDGHLIWMIAMRDALSLHDSIKNSPEFQRTIATYGKENSLNLFLGKWMMSNDLMNSDVFLVAKFTFFVRCIEHRENLNNAAKIYPQRVFLFMQERPWFAEFAEFVKLRGINIIPAVNFSLYLKLSLLKFDQGSIVFKELCKKAVYMAMVVRYWLKRLWASRSQMRAISESMPEPKRLEKNGPLMAIEHYGYLNFDFPEMFSDLFFLPNSLISSEDILIYFGLPKIPVTDVEWDMIRERGMSAVVINPLATTTPRVPLFHHQRKKIEARKFPLAGRGKKEFLNNKWLGWYLSDYDRRYHYWIDFIRQHNVKMHVTWFKYSPDHCAKLDALKNTSGIGIVYQRSYDFFLAPWSLTTADVVFGFSKLGAHEQDKHSVIPYYVITGYLGDYRFDLLRKRAQAIRDSLQKRGAKKIVAYFDEHAKDHPYWNLAYKATLENYSCLLNKVLENPWFGLILKPKVPSTLRLRLGPVSDLLHEAEKTGRCFVFEEGSLQGSYPPAAASLGADIAIHGHLFAATAGIESALAGIPTAILDCEGTLDTPLYNLLGEERIIFKDMKQLWQACEEHWNHPGGISKFADWSTVLDELDPFRDGRAAERMGIYLKWLIEGFKTGLPRETILADAAQRYSKIWGKDKILSINSLDPMGQFAAA